MSRNCPKCGIYAPSDLRVCPCGRKLPMPSAQRRFNPYLLALLLLIVPVVYLVWAKAESAAVREVAVLAENKPPQKPTAAACVVISGLTLDESSVPQNGTTVLRGTAVNTCNETLNDVVLRLVIHDDKGRTQTGGVEIFELKPSVAQPFKRNWVGTVTAWEAFASK